MAKTKPSTLPSSKSSNLLRHAPPRPRPRKSKPQPSPATLLAEASSLIISSSPDRAFPLALRALNGLQTTPPTTAALPALNLLAQIQLELGDGDAAREYFLQAVELDPDGQVPESDGGGAEKFLWLAQLSEEGGRDSVDWFERGCAVLRRQIASLEEEATNIPPSTASEHAGDDVEDMLAEAKIRGLVEEKKDKLAEALCGIVEIYMTDLSLEPDAESQCESLIAEALRVAPHSPEPLQTLASVRISQLRTEETKDALTQSLGLWKSPNSEEDGGAVDEEASSRVPDFPTRISLARLLMEVSMLEEALTVLERLVSEDDQSVEAWYLGGWCLYLAAEMNKDSSKTTSDKDELKNSRQWLQESLRLYNRLEYEDDRLRDHALELVTDLNRELDESADDDTGDPGVEEGWEDEDDDEDQEMEGA